MSGTGWRPIFRQTAPFVQPTDDWESYNPTETDAPNFSALDTLESCRDSQSKLHLKIVWPNREAPNYNEWKQTSNPIDNPTVTGYEPVDIHFTSQSWGGLERQSGGSALLDGSVGVGSWYYAIGARQLHGTGIPGASDSESMVELYAMCPGGKQPSLSSTLFSSLLFSSQCITLWYTALIYMADALGCVCSTFKCTCNALYQKAWILL